MKQNLLFFLTAVFLFVFIFLPKAFVFAQAPAFEIYYHCDGCPPCLGFNCTPYPEVENVTVTKSTGTPTYVYITAHVFDVSGVSSVVLKVQNPDPAYSDPEDPNHYIYTESMHDNCTFPEPNTTSCAPPKADGWYGIGIDVSGKKVSHTGIWDDTETYLVDIWATDNLNNNSMIEGNAYVNVLPNGFTTGKIDATKITAYATPSIVNTTGAPLVTFSATLSSGGSAISGAPIKFYKDSITTQNLLGTASTISGKASINYTAPSIPGEYSFWAKYEGITTGILRAPAEVEFSLNVGNYGACAVNSTGLATVCITTDPPTLISTTTVLQSITSFGFSKDDGITFSDNLTATADQQIIYRATIPSAPDRGDLMFLDVTDSNYSPTATINSGAMQTTWFPGFVGTHNIEVSFPGDYLNNLKPSIRSAWLTINTAPIDTTGCATSAGGDATVCITLADPISPIAVSPNTTPQTITNFTAVKNVSGTAATLTATLNPVAFGELISFMDITGGLTKSIGVTTVNSSGIATKIASGISSWATGPHTLEVIYKGNALKLLDPSVKTVLFVK